MPATLHARTGRIARRTASRLWHRRVIAVPLLLAAVVTGAATSHPLYTVRPGDTLSAIALRYHTTVARLVALNHLPGNGNLIFAGQTLRLPGAAAQRTASGTSSSHIVIRHYTVVPGDSLYGIAARLHVRPDVIARRNHLPSSLVVMIGQRLAIPERVRTITHQSASGTQADQVRRDWAILDRRHEPSRTHVERMIRRTAQRWGLDPRLALAISWQESGFNMREVSPVGAVGAMQIMPYTAAYLAADVVHAPLDIFRARDNITAGVALLSVLMHETNSPRLAAAGYYQGLGSVRAHGMLRSTRQYVRDVMWLRNDF
jgi:LysM repeat protein